MSGWVGGWTEGAVAGSAHEALKATHWKTSAMPPLSVVTPPHGCSTVRAASAPSSIASSIASSSSSASSASSSSSSSRPPLTRRLRLASHGTAPWLPAHGALKRVRLHLRPASSGAIGLTSVSQRPTRREKDVTQRPTSAPRCASHAPPAAQQPRSESTWSHCGHATSLVPLQPSPRSSSSRPRRPTRGTSTTALGPHPHGAAP